MILVTSAGYVSLLAGTQTSGYIDGIASAAKFNNPQGVAVDTIGVVYVADTDNNAIRRITTQGTTERTHATNYIVSNQLHFFL